MIDAPTSRPTDGSHLPVLHLIGTGKGALLAQYEDAYTALNTALGVLYRCNPHGRDYYPKGEDAYTVARDEFLRRVRLVEGVMADVMADYDALAGRGNGMWDTRPN